LKGGVLGVFDLKPLYKKLIGILEIILPRQKALNASQLPGRGRTQERPPGDSRDPDIGPGHFDLMGNFDKLPEGALGERRARLAGNTISRWSE